MGSAASQYLDELYQHFRYLATWSPGTPLALGTVGEFQDGIFVPTSDLASFGIRFETIKDNTPIDYNHASEGSVEVTVKAKGETNAAFKSLSALDAGVAVQFKRAHAVFFTASNCYEDRIADIVKLKCDVRSLPAGAWPVGCAVVTHLHRAAATTVLISSSAGSRVEIKATADLGPSAATLADVGAQLAIAYTDKMTTEIVARHGLTPLFRALTKKRRFLGGDDIVYQALEDSDEWEELVYERIPA